MVNIPIREIALTGTPDATSLIVFDNGAMRKGTVGSLADGVRPVASQGEAQAGANNTKTMTPLRVKESIAAEVGVSLQPVGVDLTAIEALTGSGVAVRVGSGDWLIQTGSDNYLPKWSSGGLGSSVLFDNGTNVGVGTASPAYKLDVAGTFHVTSAATLSSTLGVSGLASFGDVNAGGTLNVAGAGVVGNGTDANLSLNGGAGSGNGAILQFTGQGVTHLTGHAGRILGGSSPAYIDFTAGTNDRIFFNNNIETLRLAGTSNFVGIGSATPAWLVDVRQASSAVPWTTLTTLWNTNRTVVGNYPIGAQYATNTVGTVEVVVGAVDIPATTNALLLNAWGTAGYARTASSQTAAVGFFGFSGATANGAFGSFGGNTIATNSPSSHSGTQSGYDILSLYGFESDVNLYKLAGGGAPITPIRGMYIIGGSEVQTLNIANGIEIDAHGVFSTPKIPWKIGIEHKDGASIVAMSIGTTGVGNFVGSQSLQFRARDAGGVARNGTIQLSPNGDFAVTPANLNGAIALQDGSGVNVLLTRPTYVEVAPTTQSTSTASGALIVGGGVGIVKDVFIGGEINVTGTAYTAYTPTITSGGGTLTAASATGHYKQIGKTVFFSILTSIVTNGTGSGSVNVTLPFTVANHSSCEGRETAIAPSIGITGLMLSGGNTLILTKYDGTYPGANGSGIVISGQYERA